MCGRLQTVSLYNSNCPKYGETYCKDGANGLDRAWAWKRTSTVLPLQESVSGRPKAAREDGLQSLFAGAQAREPAGPETSGPA